MSKQSSAGIAMRYVFLRVYSNSELQDYLTSLMEQGLVIDRCKGNFLFFRRHNMKNARLCVVSAECSKPSAKDDYEVNEYIDIARRQGWQLLCVGDFESLLPMRRRLYFYTTDPSVEPLEPDEAIDFQNGYRAYHSTAKGTVAWAALALAATAISISFMLANGLYLSLLLLSAALLSVTAASLLLCLDRRKLYDHVTKQTPLPASSFLGLRKRENFMLGSMAALLAGMVLLLLA